MYDFDFEGWAPTDETTAQAIEELDADATDLRLVASQCTPDEQFLALADTSAEFAHGGYPGLRSVHVARDPITATVRVEHAGSASLAHAEAWLLARGADSDRLVRDPDQAAAADSITEEIERRTRLDGARMRVVEHFSDYDAAEGTETWILVHDEDPEAELPFVVQIEQDLPDLGVYSIREGAFADRDAAVRWIETREGALPDVPDRSVSSRQAAALSRTAATAPEPAGPTLAHPVRQPAPVAATGPTR